MKKCPVCGGIVSSAMRCSSCGADILDPDIQAMANSDDDTPFVPSADEWGTMDVRKVLGVRYENLQNGSAMRRLAGVGGLLLFVSFLIPLTLDFHKYDMSWTAARTGPALALLFPAIAGLMALVLAVLPRGGVALALGRSLALATIGLFILLYCVPALGTYARTPVSLPLYWLGAVVAAVAITGRLYHPTDKLWRVVLIVAAVVTSALMWLPLSDIRPYMPTEFRFGRYDDELADVSLAMMNLRGMKSGFSTLLMGLWGFLPALLIPLAAFVAWARPTGLIDKASVGLRFAAWALLLFVPLSYFVWMFAATGDRTDVFVRLEDVMTTLERFSNGLLAGRVRLALTATAAAVWLQFGALAAVDQLRFGAGPDAGKEPAAQS